MKDGQYNTKITCHIIFKTFIRFGKCECNLISTDNCGYYLCIYMSESTYRLYFVLPTFVLIPEYLLNPFNS